MKEPDYAQGLLEDVAERLGLPRPADHRVVSKLIEELDRQDAYRIALESLIKEVRSAYDRGEPEDLLQALTDARTTLKYWKKDNHESQ